MHNIVRIRLSIDIKVKGDVAILIKSSSALRNDYDNLVKLSHEQQEPIYITRNGEGEMVAKAGYRMLIIGDYLCFYSLYEKRSLRMSNCQISRHSRSMGLPSLSTAYTKKSPNESALVILLYFSPSFDSSPTPI